MKRIAAFAFSLSMLAVPAHAQDGLLSSCASLEPVTRPEGRSVPDEVTEQFQFLCGQVVSTLTSVQPSVGIAFSGGSHTLGTATTIGRRLGVFPRVAVSARLNGAWADAPDLLDGFDPTLQGGEVPPMGTVGIPVGSLQGDVTVGLFNGLSFGPMMGGLGAVDLLGSVSYVPAVDAIGLTQDIINVGIGARLGILQQGLVLPGISVSGMYRTMLDDVAFGTIDGGDPAEFSTDLSTVSLRAGISKGLLMFDVSAGAGYDRYSSDVAFDFLLTCPADECGEEYVVTTENGISGPLTTAAWNVHGNVGFSLLLLNIVAEAGYQKAMDVLDAAALQDAGLGEPGQEATIGTLDDGRFFGSIGIRLTI